jgi:hypothetical protein
MTPTVKIPHDGLHIHIHPCTLIYTTLSRSRIIYTLHTLTQPYTLYTHIFTHMQHTQTSSRTHPITPIYTNVHHNHPYKYIYTHVHHNHPYTPMDACMYVRMIVCIYIQISVGPLQACVRNALSHHVSCLEKIGEGETGKILRKRKKTPCRTRCRI